MNITKEMITAGHKAVMERGEVILSADLLRRIYLSMATVANQKKTLSSPLTDEQINEAYGAARVYYNHVHHEDVVRIARAIERAHGIGGDA